MPEHAERQLELLAEIGRRLKAARESQGLTVQDVATRTRIHSAYLVKIEAGDIEGLPGLTFVRGFMRNYIQTLGIDDHSLLETVAELGQTPAATLPPQPLRAATTEKLLGMETERTNWTRWLLIGALVILVVWVGYLVVRVSTSGDSTPAPAATSSPQPPTAAPATPLGGALPAPTPSTTPSIAPVPGATPRPGAATEPRPNLRLTVRGLEDTWVRLTLDRQPPVDVLVRPAESLNFDANEEIRLTVGKSQGVSIYLNGEEVALPAGRNRLVADMVLNKLSLIKMQN